MQRDRIADNLNVSAGTVSRTVSEWRDRLGAPLAEEVRDLCVIAKTQNVTLLQCAEGFRFLNQLKNCGLKLDQIMPFILEFYNLCVSADFVEIGEIIKAFSSEYTQILQELKDHRNLRMPIAC